MEVVRTVKASCSNWSMSLRGTEERPHPLSHGRCYDNTHHSPESHGDVLYGARLPYKEDRTESR